MNTDHVSHEDRVRRQVERANFRDEKMNKLAKDGSVAAIRERAQQLLPVKPKEDPDPVLGLEPPPYDREVEMARLILDAIDQLERIDRIIKKDADARTKRSPQEMDSVQPLNRATLEGGRENL
jgi:hypothetical protein